MGGRQQSARERARRREERERVKESCVWWREKVVRVMRGRVEEEDEDEGN